MNAYDLVLELRSKGYSIIADGSYLDISPAENLPPELVQQLRQSKAEVLCVLHREEELKQLVRLVSVHNDFSKEDYEEALSDALADPINALTCFAGLAHEAGLLLNKG